VKVYWSKCGHGHGNFGDKITPLLLRHYGIPVEWSPPEHAELIGVGSILEKVSENFKGTIWTTGFMHETSRRNFSRARVLGVRGQLTLEKVKCQNRGLTVVGDAGLLCNELARPARQKCKLGIIPHFVDIADPMVKALAASSSDIRLIDICAETSEVMRAAAECEHILSSSLHGLILADSLGIPNRWLELNRGTEIITGAGFKYRDYYSIFGMRPEPFRLVSATTLDDVLNAIDRSPRLGLEPVKSSLRASFTQIKDSIRPLTEQEVLAQQDATGDWQRRLAELQRVTANVIPSGARVVVADEEQLRAALTGIQSVPFLEREGLYWGPPGSAEEAIAQIQREVQQGTSWFMIAWPMFWMLEKYPEFAGYLRENFDGWHDSAIARIFRVRRVPTNNKLGDTTV
jgi:pyruvyltransferase